MATTKTVISLWEGFTLTAGAGPTTSTAVATIDDSYGAALQLSITNVTAMGTPAQLQIQVSQDNSGWYNFGGELIGLSGSSTAISWGGIEIPIGVEFLRIVATHQGTSTNVTVSALLSEVTSI